MISACDVRLLGGFAVRVDGQSVSPDSWRSRRAADLVKLLALEPGHRMHREQAMDALWPDLSREAASANLRKAVHFARRTLGNPEAFSSQESMLDLWPSGPLGTDLDRFEHAASEALRSGDPQVCAAVAGAYGGDLLPADRYEPWTSDHRLAARQRYLSLLRAAGLWDRVLELDPTDEAAHRSLMQRHYEAGDRREAIRQFELLRGALREHIGVGPDAATVALYEKVLAMEGHDPPGPRERAAALLANGLVAWSRRDLAEAQKLARDARALALDAELGHELGEASTLLALISYATGTWHELFRNEFADSVRRGPELEMAVFDAHLCFQEFYLHGSDGHEGADRFAHELLEMASQADSKAGRALAALLLGEFALLSGSLDRALEYLREAARWAEQSGCVSAHSIALERLAETEVLRGNVAVARSLLREALPIAEASGIPSHLVIRVFGVGVLAAETTVDRLRAVAEGERWITDASRVCEPCSMTFRIEATRAFARAGVLQRARIHLAEAERITGLWQGGPWTAAIWEARAEVRRAEGDAERARALFLEASQRFGELNRPLDEARCLAAADLAG